jgi:hypothetical protein
MRKKDDTSSTPNADVLAELFTDFDFGVSTGHFLIYELAALIDEDRASFEDEDFRRIIDSGIHEHVEDNVETRARMAAILREAFPGLEISSRQIASRTIRALEDVSFPLQNVSLVVRTYTAYMFRRLQDAADTPTELEDEAARLIERWKNGEILREQMTRRLKEIGDPAVGPIGDMLFEAPDDAMTAETAIDLLADIRTLPSSRILAFAVSEPILAEALEMKTYALARATWPMPRSFILSKLSSHDHEDLSFRWFQLLIESDELTAVDMVLDEVLAHSSNPEYTEDLKAILELLRLSRDPDVEAKLVAQLNDPETPPEGVALIQEFVSRFQPPLPPADNPWTRHARALEVNQKYLEAAKLFDSGRLDDSKRAVEAVLKRDPEYPFALTLKRLMS